MEQLEKVGGKVLGASSAASEDSLSLDVLLFYRVRESLAVFSFVGSDNRGKVFGNNTFVLCEFAVQGEDGYLVGEESGRDRVDSLGNDGRRHFHRDDKIIFQISSVNPSHLLLLIHLFNYYRHIPCLSNKYLLVTN